MRVGVDVFVFGALLGAFSSSILGDVIDELGCVGVVRGADGAVRVYFDNSIVEYLDGNLVFFECHDISFLTL